MVLLINIQRSYSTPFLRAIHELILLHLQRRSCQVVTTKHTWYATQQILEPGLSSLRPGISQQGAHPKPLPNARTSVPHQQPFLGSQSSKSASSLFRSQLQSNNHLATMSSPPPKLIEQDIIEGKNGQYEYGLANSLSLGCKEQPATDKAASIT